MWLKFEKCLDDSVIHLYFKFDSIGYLKRMSLMELSRVPGSQSSNDALCTHITVLVGVSFIINF